MAKYQGELRGRKLLCYAVGCDDLAVPNQQTGLCILCGKHWKEKLSGVDVVLAGNLSPDPNARYVIGHAVSGESIPIFERPGKLLSFRALPDVPRESLAAR
jgi:hypothetical protein